MRLRLVGLVGSFALCMMQPALAQELRLPKTVTAGEAFSMQSTGSGKAVLYVVGIGQVLKRDVQLGETESFPAGTLYNAGHYLVLVVGASPKRADRSTWCRQSSPRRLASSPSLLVFRLAGRKVSAAQPMSSMPTRIL